MGLKGYTFDRMKISPKADALLYHSMLDGNDRIVKGYKDELKVVATGLNTYVSPGACVIQGRMIEVDEEMQLSVSANNSGYVCVVIDLTQNNTSTGEAGTSGYTPVNNQLRLEVVKELVQQDLFEDGKLYAFPLASFTSTGTTVNLTKIDHNQRIVESGSNSRGEWTKFADGTMIQYSSKITTPAPNIQVGSIWRSESLKIDFPLVFSGLKTPAVSINVDSDAGYTWSGLGARAVGNDGATVAIFSATKYDNTAKVSITAIGRWK